MLVRTDENHSAGKSQNRGPLSVANIMFDAANMMHVVAAMIAEWVVKGRPGSVSLPYKENANLLLNENLGIFMHLDRMYFSHLEIGLFQTHPPTLSKKFQIF